MTRPGQRLPSIDPRGLAILDDHACLQWIHRGTSLGDYPPVDDLLARADDLRLGRPNSLSRTTLRLTDAGRDPAG